MLKKKQNRSGHCDPPVYTHLCYNNIRDLGYVQVIEVNVSKELAVHRRKG